MTRKARQDMRWEIVKTENTISTIEGWALQYDGDTVAEFYGVPYAWVRKTLTMWKRLGKPYEDEDEY